MQQKKQTERHCRKYTDKKIEGVHSRLFLAIHVVAQTILLHDQKNAR